MSYLDSLPNDVIQEICQYLTDGEIKFVIQIRNYIDIDLISKFMTKQATIACKKCNRYDLPNNMSYKTDHCCTDCYDKLIFCSYDGNLSVCDNIIDLNSQNSKQCPKCDNICCGHHYSHMIQCCRCAEIMCPNHYKGSRKYCNDCLSIVVSYYKNW